MTESEDPEDVQRVQDWVGRLQAFASALDGLEGTTPSDFCESACLAWQSIAMSDSPPPASPAMLIIVQAFGAMTRAMKTVALAIRRPRQLRTPRADQEQADQGRSRRRQARQGDQGQVALRATLPSPSLRQVVARGRI